MLKNHDLAIENIKIEIFGLEKTISELEPAVPLKIIELKEQLEEIVIIVESLDNIFQLFK